MLLRFLVLHNVFGPPIMVAAVVDLKNRGAGGAHLIISTTTTAYFARDSHSNIFLFLFVVEKLGYSDVCALISLI